MVHCCAVIIIITLVLLATAAITSTAAAAPSNNNTTTSSSRHAEFNYGGSLKILAEGVPTPVNLNDGEWHQGDIWVTTDVCAFDIRIRSWRVTGHTHPL